MRTMVLDRQWVYALVRAYAGAAAWVPVALIDKHTGVTYPLVPVREGG